MTPRPVVSDAVHRYLVAYDVGQDPARNRVAKALESYGDRVQYSVFVLELKPARLHRLRGRLGTLINLETDSVLICDLGPLSHGGLMRISYIGLPRTITGQGPLIF